MGQEYDPNALLDAIAAKLQLKNDAALSRALEVGPPLISKIRHLKVPAGASLLIRIHEVTNIPVRELQNLMGDRRRKYRLSPIQGDPKRSLTSLSTPYSRN